jgi:hypothetical protein
MANRNTNLGTTRYDVLQTRYAANYQSQLSFIADEILGEVVVDHESDKYAVFSAKGKYNKYDDVRAKGAPANLIDNLRVGDETYSCVERALKIEAFWQDMADESKIIMEKNRKTANLMDGLKIGKEFRASELVFGATNYDSNHKEAAPTKWDSDEWVSYNPRPFIKEKMRIIEKRIGRRPNLMVINSDVADGLLESPFIQAYLSSNVEKNIDEAVLQRFFGIDKVLIGRGSYNSANIEKDVVMTDMWTDNVLICWTQKAATVNDASFGKTFKWNGKFKATTQNRGIVGVRSWSNEETKTDYVEAEMNYIQKITFQDAAFLITDVLI